MTRIFARPLRWLWREWRDEPTFRPVLLWFVSGVMKVFGPDGSDLQAWGEILAAVAGIWVLCHWIAGAARWSRRRFRLWILKKARSYAGESSGQSAAGRCPRQTGAPVERQETPFTFSGWHR